MKFVVNRANIKQDIAIYKLENLSEMYGLPDTSSGLLCISQKILKYFDGCMSFNIGLINTKLENAANFNLLFLTIWVSGCLSHNKLTRTQPLDFKLGNVGYVKDMNTKKTRIF